MVRVNNDKTFKTNIISYEISSKTKIIEILILNNVQNNSHQHSHLSLLFVHSVQIIYDFVAALLQLLYSADLLDSAPETVIGIN